MQITHIIVKNILGIKELEFKPGQVNVIDGPNGSGKTSFLEAIKDVVGGGHNGTLLRNGHKKGSIVLVFDDGTNIIKEIGQEKSKVTVKNAKGIIVQKGATFIKNIIDNVGVNPIKLLTAAPRDQVDILLSSIDLNPPDKELIEILGEECPAETNPLIFIDQQRGVLYNERTAINREIKDKTVAVEQMRETMPNENEVTGARKKLKDLERKKSEADRKLRSEQKIIDEKQGNDLIDLVDNFNGKYKALEIKYREENAVLDCEKNNLINSIKQNAQSAESEIKIRYDSLFQDLAEKIGKAAQLSAQEDKLKIGVEYIKEGEKLIEQNRLSSEQLTERIAALDSLKVDLLRNIPIEGLEIKDGEMLLDGIPFETVNEAKRIQFCLSVASMRNPDLPLVCVDGLEALDNNSFKLFQDEAKKTNKQFFVTRVTDDQEMSLKKN